MTRTQADPRPAGRPRETGERIPAARGYSRAKKADRPPTRTTHSWHSERRRGLITAASVALLFGALGGYGVHAQIAAEAARATARLHQIAAETKAGLRNGPVLFVPLEGNVCRRRWIDNATWTLREGGEVVCDEAVSWNATVPVPQYVVGMRMDAVRSGFRSKVPGLE